MCVADKRGNLRATEILFGSITQTLITNIPIVYLLKQKEDLIHWYSIGNVLLHLNLSKNQCHTDVLF
jgi:hypothetical protein